MHDTNFFPSIFNQSSFYALKDWIKEIRRYGPNECVIAIAGNKCDLDDQREVKFLREYWVYFSAGDQLKS